MQDEYKIPVIIGSGRTTKSPFGPLSAAGGFTPAGLIGEALELAVADAGAGDEIYQSIDAWGSPQFTTGGETNNVLWLVAKKYGITLCEGDRPDENVKGRGQVCNGCEDGAKPDANWRTRNYGACDDACGDDDEGGVTVDRSAAAIRQQLPQQEHVRLEYLACEPDIAEQQPQELVDVALLISRGQSLGADEVPRSWLAIVRQQRQQQPLWPSWPQDLPFRRKHCFQPGRPWVQTLRAAE